MKKLLVVVMFSLLLTSCTDSNGDDTVECRTDQFHNETTNTCEEIPTCSTDEIYNEELNVCEIDIPECMDDEELNEETNTCEKVLPTCNVGSYDAVLDTCVSVILEDMIDITLLEQFKVTIDISIVNEFKSLEYTELVYYDEEIAVFIMLDKVYVWRDDNTITTYGDITYLNEMTRNRTIGFDKLSNNLIYYTDRSIKSFNLDTLENTLLLNSSEGVYFNYTGGINLHGNTVSVFDNLAQIITTFPYENVEFISRSQAYIYDNHTEGCTVKGYDGSLELFNISLNGECVISAYEAKDYYMVVHTDDTNTYFTAIDVANNTFTTITHNELLENLYFYRSGKVFTVENTNDNSITHYDLHFQVLDFTDVDELLLDIAYYDDTYIYGFNPTGNHMRVRRDNVDATFIYPNETYATIRVCQQYVFLHKTNDNYQLGDLYNEANEVVLSEIEGFHTINEQYAVYFKETLEGAYQGYIFDFATGTSYKVEGMEGSFIWTDMVDGFVRYYTSFTSVHDIPGNPASYQGEGRIILIDPISLETIHLKQLNIGLNPIYEDDQGNLYQFN